MTGKAEVVRVERRVAARPAAIYAYLTTSERWARWQGVSATLDASPNGAFEMRMPNGAIAQGRFVELVPDARVVFTWGWQGSETLPPGSSTVEIELLPDGDGTLIRLSHRGLPAEDRPTHAAGWAHYVSRLATAGEGADPGPDPGPG
jgi:uncharacterized protein YndB with AHSA1/START domain